MIYVLIGLIGLALGSFTNALVWRVNKQSSIKSAKKRAEFSILKGRSMCPECKHTLSAKDLIPVLSWVSLRGKCRYCKKPISWQYPLVELLFSASLLFAYYFWPFTLTTVQNGILFTFFAVITVLIFGLSIIDIEYQLLPSRLVYPLGVVSLIFVLLSDYFTQNTAILVSSAIGSVLLFSIFWLVYQVSVGKWIGGGDVRILFIIGLLLGWQKGVLAVVLASYLASAVVLVLIVLRKYKKHMRIAFGPFLLMATYLVLLFGDQIISAYKTISGL